MGILWSSRKGDWLLSGALDDGRKVDCDSLVVTSSTFGSEKSQAIFHPLGLVTIGETGEPVPNLVRYSLVGHYEGDFSTACDGWSFSTSRGGVDAAQASRILNGWEMVAEGMTLAVRHRGSAHLEDYELHARQVMRLLAIANGTGVTYHRSIAEWETGETYEVWGQGAEDEPGPGKCVPAREMQGFVDACLPVWSSWPQEKRDICRMMVWLLNRSHNGYLDKRFLEIWQAWEILSGAWTPRAQPRTEEAELKRRVLEVCAQWRTTHPNLDPKGQWPERLSFAFRWPQARSRIAELIASRHLDAHRIGLDIRALKTARDSVAHSGKLPEPLGYNPNSAYDLLRSAQFGLQLILLIELGYRGLVVGLEGNWVTRKPLSTYLSGDAEQGVAGIDG
jgi:hypothetical protein